MRLLLVEVRRFFTRRFGLVMSLATVGVMGAILVISMANSHKPTDSEIAYAEAEANRARADAEVEQAECLRMTDLPREVQGEYNYFSGEDCDVYDPGLVDTADYLSGVITFTQDAPPLMYAFGSLIALAGLVTAASFIGAEWPSGGMTNLMLWKPRRMEVFFSKLAASVITVTAGAVGLSAIFLFLLWVITSVGGYVGDFSGAWLANFVEQCLRMAVLPILLTLIGFAIAMLGRRTAAALGALAGYAVVFEFGMRLLAQLLPGLYYLEAALLSPYVIAWLDGEYFIRSSEYYYDSSSYDDMPAGINIDTLGGISVLVLFTAALVGLAALVFKRRDVASN
ncbi:ABC transporter permease subunit [Phytomonospora sp. NPDC050363]|uniref:ABC transporter permease subunit n=1 Tax=Phytomonospora sp. NPDC050363 TaxID=3155642 RepID=UPI003400C925